MVWNVALKAPHGRDAQFVAEGSDSWTPADSIDDWIATVMAGDWTGHFVYNDEPAGEEPASGGGHCKGVLVWSDDAAGWLIHSVPCWPAQMPVDAIRVNETHFGQSFVWLKLERDALPGVFRQLRLMRANPCFSQGSDDMWSPMKRAPPVSARINSIELAPGVTHVSKHPKWGQDIFEQLCDTFGGPCLAETWLRPEAPQTDNVSDVDHLTWPGTDVVYHESQDHSKWAVSVAGDAPWTYVGDLNRMTSQKHRGGGGVVIQDAELWRLMRSLVVDTKA